MSGIPLNSVRLLKYQKSCDVSLTMCFRVLALSRLNNSSCVYRCYSQKRPWKSYCHAKIPTENSFTLVSESSETHGVM